MSARPAAAGSAGEEEWLRLALPRRVLERLLRERILFAAELHSLDEPSHRAAQRALLDSLCAAEDGAPAAGQSSSRSRRRRS